MSRGVTMRDCPARRGRGGVDSGSGMSNPSDPRERSALPAAASVDVAGDVRAPDPIAPLDPLGPPAPFEKTEDSSSGSFPQPEIVGVPLHSAAPPLPQEPPAQDITRQIGHSSAERMANDRPTPSRVPTNPAAAALEDMYLGKT